MLIYLFWGGLALAVLDLYLTWRVWELFGFPVLLALIFLPVFLLGPLVRLTARRLVEKAVEDPKALAEGSLVLLLWPLLLFPGPVTKLLVLLLLIPWPRRWLLRAGWRGLKRHAQGAGLSGLAPGGAQVNVVYLNAAPGAPAPRLKDVQGEVIATRDLGEEEPPPPALPPEARGQEQGGGV